VNLLENVHGAELWLDKVELRFCTSVLSSTIIRADAARGSMRLASAFLLPALSSFGRGAKALSSYAMSSTSLGSLSCSTIPDTSGISFVDSATARRIDELLMDMDGAIGSKQGFSIDQLMELAGLSVATAANDFISSSGSSSLNSATATVTSVSSSSSSPVGRKILVLAGPGNNGGDGLVAARHLAHFGYEPRVVHPKFKGTLFENLRTQCNNLGIALHTDLTDDIDLSQFDLIIDALFGFSFRGPVRDPYVMMMKRLAESSTPVLSVDVPSGWDVEKGDIDNTGFRPDAVVSLTLPKLCMEGYTGTHYIGGRFMPPALVAALGLSMPDYGAGGAQVVKVQHTPPREPLSAVYVTAPDMDVGRSLAKALLDAKLVACVNISPKVVSMYVWEGKVEEEEEVLLMIKTRSALVKTISDTVNALHPYDVPEVISVALDNDRGNPAYLDWVVNTTRGAGDRDKTC